MAELDDLYDAILTGNQKTAVEVTQTAIDDGVDPEKLVNGYMIKAMDEVGRRFEANEFFVPELLIAARAMKGSLQLLKPLIEAKGLDPIGTVAIGTVKGDLHDIGKNLVASMMEGAGFAILDLGVDVSPDKFVEAVRENGANIICLSALLTTTMPSMKSTIDALSDAGVRDNVKVLIGGAPVTQQYADEVGADAYGDNANSAVVAARELLNI